MFHFLLVNGKTGEEVTEESFTTETLDFLEDHVYDLLMPYLIERDRIKVIKRDSESSSDSDVEQIFSILHFDNTYHEMEVRVSKKNHNKNHYN